MKLINSVKVSVFCYENDSEDEIIKGLRFIFPLDFEKEKIRIEKRTAEGFNEKKIITINILMQKDSQNNAFLDNINKNLSEQQKELIKRQAESRLDENLDFFLRFDKDKIIKEKKLWIIDGGNCYHVRMSVAAFPKRRETALDVVRNKMFK